MTAHLVGAHERVATRTRPQEIGQPRSESANVVEVTSLRKAYLGVKVLDGVTFSVRRGAIFGLLGPNGAGKSTTIRILTTLARQDGGQARVLGIDVARHPERVRGSIGVVAQKSGADQEATGRENLMLQGRIFGMRPLAIRHRIDELLSRFDLTSVADRRVLTYSGGLQRRLDIAMALVHQPQILFLDEPSTGLDPESRALLWSHILDLNRTHDLTVLLTTHYLEEADRLADRLAIIDCGSVIAEGTPTELKSELHGDIIKVETVDDQQDDLVRQALASLPGVQAVTADGRQLEVGVANGRVAVPAVLAELDQQGVAVSSITVARPSLDDVYLQLTGHRFDQAGRSTGEASL